MTSPKGEPVGAVFGFTRDLLYLLEEKRPDYLFCAFDLPGKTFRHALYEEYKIQRAEMPDDLVPQIPAIRRVIAALGIPALACESYEADDVLATAARADRRTRRPMLSGDRRQRLPPVDHRAREGLQHPQERGFRRRRAPGGMGNCARAGGRFPGVGGRFGGQCAGRAVDRAKVGPAIARTVRHPGGRFGPCRRRAGGETTREPAEVPRPGPIEPRVGPPRCARADRHRLERRPRWPHRLGGGAGPVSRFRLPQHRAETGGAGEGEGWRVAGGGWRGTGGEYGVRSTEYGVRSTEYEVRSTVSKPWTCRLRTPYSVLRTWYSRHPPPATRHPSPVPLHRPPRRHARGIRVVPRTTPAAEILLARYRDDQRLAALGKAGGHVAGLERPRGVVSPVPYARRRAPPRRRRNPGRLEADSGRPNRREDRPEPEVRHDRAAGGGDRAGRRGLRHDGGQLPVGSGPPQPQPRRVGPNLSPSRNDQDFGVDRHGQGPAENGRGAGPPRGRLRRRGRLGAAYCCGRYSPKNSTRPISAACCTGSNCR